MAGHERRPDDVGLAQRLEQLLDQLAAAPAFLDPDVVLTGGSEAAISPVSIAAFASMKALSERNDSPETASRPFDATRDGFVLGEGAGMVVLEDLERAKARGAHIYGEICGYGSTADAFRITDTHPEGRGAIACMEMAIRDAQIDPSEVNYVNAHGTSTKVNDAIETKAIKTVFGDRRVAVSSNKSMIGHTLGAAGAIEAAASTGGQLMPPVMGAGAFILAMASYMRPVYSVGVLLGPSRVDFTEFATPEFRCTCRWAYRSRKKELRSNCSHLPSRASKIRK